ncbi:hypothetical protein [Chitinophaga flava]|uniref:Uncharacterized protein n=1 Tax=Chitinophaga flava TaxID=2259036 RepID=A0A365XYN7_9BACT|nr:hypothetical protein [Chitinophaga flava]RBL91350.1 hypothetical protein DF182_01625 [Chitinophaga flava]
MSDFKVIFPAFYNVDDVLNDNLDVNIIFPDGGVFFIAVFTISNLEMLMKNSGGIYFWSSDMVVVRDLNKETIKEAISQIIRDGYYESAFCKIGTIETVYSKVKSYEDIESEV